MYLKTDRIVASIKDVTFRSYRTGVGDEYILDPTALTGWDDGTNVRRNATVRPVSSGDFTEPSTFGSRVIGFSGTAIAQTVQGLQALRDVLTGVLAENEYSELTIQTIASIRYATVGIEGKVEWIKQTDTVALFRIEFYAPDPYIYGSERTIHLNSTTYAGGGLVYPLSYPLNYNVQNPVRADMSVSNNGNVAAWPKFIVTGDYFSGFTLTDGGFKRITFAGPVTYQSPVTIDTAKGTATQNNTDQTTMLTERNWFSVSPKETLRPTFTPIQDASGWCVIIIRDTYI